MITNNQLIYWSLYQNMQHQIESLPCIVLPEPRTLPNISEQNIDQKDFSIVSSCDKIQSLQILGSNLINPQRVSAFNFYVKKSREDDSLSIENNIQNDSAQNYQSEQKTTQKKQQKNSKDKKQLMRLQTKNLNRFFRSKINQLLRDIKQSATEQEDVYKANQLLQQLNSSNKIMFSQIRDVIKDPWLNARLLKCQGMLMKYVHRGKMGMSSKLVMLKYFNKILKAIKYPQKFTCWK